MTISKRSPKRNPKRSPKRSPKLSSKSSSKRIDPARGLTSPYDIGTTIPERGVVLVARQQNAEGRMTRKPEGVPSVPSGSCPRMRLWPLLCCLAAHGAALVPRSCLCAPTAARATGPFHGNTHCPPALPLPLPLTYRCPRCSLRPMLLLLLLPRLLLLLSRPWP